MYQQQDSELMMVGSRIEGNIASEASVLFVLANTFVTDAMDKEAIPLKIVDTAITHNYSKSSLVKIQRYQLLIENCKLVDNEAKYLTHGFTLNQAYLFITDSLIEFSETQFLELLVKKDLKVDTGFFDMIHESQLHL